MTDELRALRTTTEENCFLAPAGTPWEQVQHLVRQAMTVFESDRRTALQCLTVASSLLGSKSQESDCPAAPRQFAFRPGGLARWQATQVLAYIEANLGSKIEIPDLADLVDLSNSHFSRAFRRSLGLPPMAYVAIRRVERAKLMMTSTREQLTAIALDCGFADQSHLSRSFRRRVGVSPGMWRRTNVELAGGGRFSRA